MKLEWNKKYTTIAAYCLGVIVIAILFIVFVFKFESFAKGFSWIGAVSAPIIWGIGIAYVLNPLMKMLENKLFRKLKEPLPESEPAKPEKLPLFKKNSAPKPAEKRMRRRRAAARILALILTMLIVLAAITGILMLVLPSVSESVLDLANKMPEYLQQLNQFITRTFEDNPDLVKYLSSEFKDIYSIINQAADMIISSDFFGNLGTGIFNAASAVFSALKNILIGFIIAVYLLYSKERMLAQVKKIFFAFFKTERCSKIFTAASKANNIFTKYIISNLLDAIIVFCFMAIGLSVMGMPYPMLIAVICGVTNLIPFFGPFIGAIPSGLLILLVDPIKVIWFAIFVLILQQCDGNIIKPLMFGETMGLPAIWVLISIIVGGGLFGILGMLLGAPVFAVFYLLFSEYVCERLKKKSLPESTDDYIMSIEDFTKEHLAQDEQEE